MLLVLNFYRFNLINVFFSSSLELVLILFIILHSEQSVESVIKHLQVAHPHKKDKMKTVNCRGQKQKHFVSFKNLHASVIHLKMQLPLFTSCKLDI